MCLLQALQVSQAQRKSHYRRYSSSLSQKRKGGLLSQMLRCSQAAAQGQGSAVLLSSPGIRG
jgi:hypothetical protein